MPSTIPRQVLVTRDGKSYKGSYSLNGDVVTVLHTGADGVERQMSAPTDGLKVIAVARAILRELA